jgi:hypothetical protein
VHQGEQGPPRGLTPRRRLDLAADLNTRRYDDVWAKTCRLTLLSPPSSWYGTPRPGSVAGPDAVSGPFQRFLWEELELLTPEHVLWDELAGSDWFPAAGAAGLCAAIGPGLAADFLACFDPASASFLTNVPTATDPGDRRVPAVAGVDDTLVGLLWRNG